MTRWIVLALGATMVVASQGPDHLSPPQVNLLAGLPGTATQNGHIKVSGSIYAGKIITSVAGATDRAVSAASTSTTGVNYGVYATNASETGRAVYGLNSNPTGQGFGGYFQASGSNARGIFAIATHATGITYGGVFQSSSSNGRGITGYATATSGPTYGGDFRANSTEGRGIFGWATATTGESIGGYFLSDSTTGKAVYGHAREATGINYGVLGRSNSGTNGWGLFATGRSGASGTKSFRIDHPLDPENKFLQHYSAEGPEPMNLYRGTVVTDEHGYAWVTMPDYYSEINKDATYQLTTIDNSEDFVIAKVTRRMSGNRFQIRTSKPGVEVCWRVEAKRNDRFVQKYGAAVEVNKVGAERGKYQQPELYNKGPKEGMFTDPSEN